MKNDHSRLETSQPYKVADYKKSQRSNPHVHTYWRLFELTAATLTERNLAGADWELTQIVKVLFPLQKPSCSLILGPPPLPSHYVTQRRREEEKKKFLFDFLEFVDC